MDRVRVQIQFKKAIWTCPVCGLEEIEDRPMNGGASYEHTCANGHKFNQSGLNMREYNGSVSYTEEEYAKKTEEDIAIDKQKPCDDWLYSVKNPPPYVEPTKEQLEAEKSELLARVSSLDVKITEKVALEANLEK